MAALAPKPVVEALAAAIEPARRAAPQLRWSTPAWWHVTLAFLGPVADEIRPELDARLARVARRHPPILVVVTGGGHFDNRILWAGVRPPTSADQPVLADQPAAAGEPAAADRLDQPRRPRSADDGALTALAAGVRRAARRAGATSADTRPLRAHLTLARARASRREDLAPLAMTLRETIGTLPWTIDRLSLISSVDSSPGHAPTYVEQAAWPLHPR
ncbi:2'-5' RNA ligase family protein [Frankia sp. AiPa1]|uniref:2'-5' RNA ligase family protein n=1 Tax=Frankia sp. AiPa1 TaxID=573492 RepID=UPI00202B2DCE|nr:2'-5' RNA ligase family protein [Frankia sp. AiPa1]MCL9759710.1 2'-5' RNA ligase family protein [Frankia sp. AiPa1]